MSSLETFPPEIWLLIFDFALASGINLLDRCDPLSFPEIINQLRYPWKYHPTGIPALRSLRLVCRTFNALLGPSPYLILKKQDTPIPPTARAVFIYPCGEALVFLKQLLAEPSKCHRIVQLDIPGQEYRNSHVPDAFEFLCENAHSLPSVRSLTLGLHHYTSMAPAKPNYWKHLNDAFPHLVCLVLRGCLKSTVGVESSPLVTFHKLEILDLDMIYPQATVCFPSLRHTAFGSMTSYSASPFRGWSLLESLLLRDTSYLASFNWSLVPHLKLLGLPSESVNMFASLPQGHPLQHLYIYIGTVPRNDHYRDPDRNERELTWMKEIHERFPTVTWITFAYPPTSNQRSASIWGDFDGYELLYMGLFSEYTIGPRHGGDRRLVLHRTTPEPRVDPSTGTSKPPVEAVSGGGGLRAGWNSFRRFASRRLHL